MVGTAWGREIRNNRLWLTLLIGSGLGGGLAAIVQAKYLAGLINGIFLAGLDRAGLASGLDILLAAIISRAFFIWAGEVLGFRLAANIKADLRHRILARLFVRGPLYADREATGELINTAGEGVEKVEAYFAKYLPQLATTVVIPPAILAVVFSFDFTAGLIMLVTAPLIPLFMLLIGRWAAYWHRRQWQVLSLISGYFFDVLRGLTTLKIFNRSKEQLQIVARLSGQFRDSTLKVLRVAFLSAFTLELLTTLSTALVAVAVGFQLLYGKLTFYQAFFVLLLAPEYYLPLRQLGNHFHAGLAGRTAGERIYRILGPDNPGTAEPAGQPLANQGKITVNFDRVSFIYPGARRPALRSVSFSLRAGERLALVGPSGAGKSTIADLLLGFIQPTGGAIMVNGRPLAGLNRDDWLDQVAYVPQFPHLFYGTVRDNICMGRSGAAGAVEEAGRQAGVAEFINRLPGGYDTVVGEGGRGLSGGERQRIAIARAVYKNAPLLIMDEATAGLDPRNEAVIRETLARLMAGKTVLLIAHRLTTASQADRILLLDQGQVVETGSHRELLAGRGLYYRLVTTLRGKP